MAEWHGGSAEAREKAKCWTESEMSVIIEPHSYDDSRPSDARLGTTYPRIGPPPPSGLHTQSKRLSSPPCSDLGDLRTLAYKWRPGGGLMMDPLENFEVEIESPRRGCDGSERWCS